MSKEPYITPEIQSEELEAGTLACYGSPGNGDDNTQPWLAEFANPSCGFCCDD